MAGLFQETDFFLDWMPVSSKSGWVRSAAYDDVTGSLYVRYKTATCKYQVPRSMFVGLVSAPSAGTFVHQNLYRLPYTLVTI